MIRRPVVVKIPTFFVSTGRTRHVLKKARSRGTLVDEEEDVHKTDNTEPPVPPDRVCQIGSYCMRASTQLTDSLNKEIVREYNGFDETPTIVDKVIHVCERDIARLGEQYYCVPPRLFFLGPMEHCDGRVNVFDIKNNTVSVIT